MVPAVRPVRAAETTSSLMSEPKIELGVGVALVTLLVEVQLAKSDPVVQQMTTVAVDEFELTEPETVAPVRVIEYAPKVVAAGASAIVKVTMADAEL